MNNIVINKKNEQISNDHYNKWIHNLFAQSLLNIIRMW
jgi:hypothetical protein